MDAESKRVGPESVLGVKKELELVHPWPEWIELMERLVQQNYFDLRRKDEDKMVQELGFDAAVGAAQSDASGLDFKDFRTVQTACLNFGKDRFDIFRFVIHFVFFIVFFFLFILDVMDLLCKMNAATLLLESPFSVF